ncbi:MAG: hypothetical protein JJ956_01200 [Pseudomonadales bacterium]|nr:hypothetical protein [Pseudomonadales bacterium]
MSLGRKVIDSKVIDTSLRNRMTIKLFKWFLSTVLLAQITLADDNIDTAGAHAKRAQALVSRPAYFPHLNSNGCCFVIAHAGGGIDGNTYTNSLQAVDENYSLGTRYFEIDLAFTSDGHWVATHDWRHWLKKNLPNSSPDFIPTLEDFTKTRIKKERLSWSIEKSYPPSTLSDFSLYLQKHPDAHIVTDIKNLTQFQQLLNDIRQLPAKKQFVLQVYNFEQIAKVKETLPDAKIILTMYRLGNPQKFVDEIETVRGELFGITMPMNWVSDAFLKQANHWKLPVFLHGAPANINSRQLHHSMGLRGVNGFYLD